MSTGGRGEWLQCQSCGDLKQVDTSKYKIEDDIYIRMKCTKCNNKSAHLLLGSKDDVYLYINSNVDPRYYNTTK